MINNSALWNKCLVKLQGEMPTTQYNTWIKPLQSKINDQSIVLFAPNRFVVDWIKNNFYNRINELLGEISKGNELPKVEIKIGANVIESNVIHGVNSTLAPAILPKKTNGFKKNNLNKNFTFDSFIEGNSNQLAKVAAMQVVSDLGKAYNPLYIYGGVGLGKTHLMHAIGNQVLAKNPKAKVLYLHSERFVADMVAAIQSNSMEEFKKHYRDLDLLLIDDIQFFAGKNRSQEEFFHTFNALFEEQQQIILTSDKYPKEIDGVEERLKSRFGWGLTVDVEPPDLETRVAIVANKASSMGMSLPYEVSFFIAEKIKSNVRELEGALKRISANCNFSGSKVTIDFAKRVLKDLLSLQDRMVGIDNIQKVVASYFKIKVSDLSSQRRNRSVARPRQIAMFLAKDLTGHSLPEIGDAFGGRDHTTVIHACRKIKELLKTSKEMQEDYKNLTRCLTA